MMRPVYFLADPFTGNRVHIGDMVSDLDGVRFRPASGLNLGPHRFARGIRARVYSGPLTTEQRAAIRLVLHELESWRRMDALPMSVGPQVYLGEPTHPERPRS